MFNNKSKNVKNGPVIGGRNIYTNKKGQNILFDKRTGNGYIITAKDEANFNLYKNRFVLPTAAFLIAVNFLASWKVILPVCLVIAAVLEYRYRKKFLPNLTCITNFKPEKKQSLVDALVETNNKGRCLVLALLYLALGILMVINGYETKSSLPVLILDYVVMCFTTYMSCVYAKAVSKMK